MPRHAADVAMQLLRGSAMALSALAGATVLVYACRRPWLERLDQALEALYIGDAHAELAAAAGMLGRDRDAALAELGRLRDEHQGYRFGDRREQVWAVATALLAQAHLQDHPARAAELAAELATDRPQELSARLLYSDALRALGAATDADAALGELLALLPEHELVARQVAPARAAAGDWLAAGAALAAHLAALPGLALEVRFETAGDGPHRQPNQRAVLLARIDGDGRLTAPFRLPAGVTAVEIALPAGLPYELREPRLLPRGDGDGGGGDAGATLCAAAARPAGAGIEGDATCMRVRSSSGAGVDARLRFACALPTSVRTDLCFAATLGGGVSDFLVPLLQREPATAMVRALLAAGRRDDAATVDRHRRRLVLVAPPELRSTGPAGAREQAFACAGGWPAPDGIRLALHARVDAEVLALRLPWPRPADGSADLLPEIALEPVPAQAPAVARDGDDLVLSFAAPLLLAAVHVRGRL